MMSTKRFLLAGLVIAASALALVAAIFFVWNYLRQPQTPVVFNNPSQPGSTQPNGTLQSNPALWGKVIDSRTGGPIPSFSIRMGWNRDNGPPPDFGLDTPTRFIEGQYSLSLKKGSPSKGLRCYLWIEAPGHRPVMSRPLVETGQVDIIMDPAPDFEGVVVDSSGMPISGAQIGLATTQSQAPDIDLLNDTAPLRPDVGIWVSDTAGKFRLPPQIGPVTVVAYGTGGFGETTFATSPDFAKIVLAPWGGVRGEVTLGNQHKSREQIRIEQFFPSGGNGPFIRTHAETETDTDGAFQVNRVVPGQNTIYLGVKQIGPWGWSLLETRAQEITAEAGRTSSVTIGGGGKQVIGRLILPKSNATGQLFFGGIVEGLDHRQYAIDWKGATGEFKVEDLPSGAYRMSASVATMESPTPILIAERQFSVSADVSNSGMPVDLGEIAPATTQP